MYEIIVFSVCTRHNILYIIKTDQTDEKTSFFINFLNKIKGRIMKDDNNKGE